MAEEGKLFPFVEKPTGRVKILDFCELVDSTVGKYDISIEIV